MKIWKATPTLDGYLPALDYTQEKSEAEIILVGGKKFDLAEFPKLRGVFKTGVGTDNLPFDEAATRGVEIRLPSAITCDLIYEETAAFACHLVLSGLYTGSGNWASWEKRDRPILRHQQLLVLGTGKIGRRVADKMAAFMEVETFDSATDAPDQFEARVRRADAVSLHIPLTPETKGLFDAGRLGWLKDGALLVNTSRGPVVDENALQAELATGRIRAAFDVFWQEPYRGPLADLPPDRFLRTPHIASTCREFLQGTAADFLNFLEELNL